jgi:small subunit ribosomal protein S10e
VWSVFISIEGVCIAKKYFFAAKNMVLKDVQNIHVIKMMQSLATRKFVTETFNWQIYYWTLTDEGITYLREYLHLAESVVPSTHKVTKQAIEAREGGRGERRGWGAREGYRRDGYKKDDGEFRPSFVCF